MLPTLTIPPIVRRSCRDALGQPAQDRRHGGTVQHPWDSSWPVSDNGVDHCLRPLTQNGLHCFVRGLCRCIEPQAKPRSSCQQRIELVWICLSRAVSDLAKFPLSDPITLKDNSNARTENDEMSRPYRHRLEPGPNVFAEDIVLDHRGESCLAILGRRQCGQAVAEIEKPPGFSLVLIPRMRPTTYCPPVELTSPHVNTTVESVSKQVRHSGLPRRLYSHHQPDSVCHSTILANVAPWSGVPY